MNNCVHKKWVFKKQKYYINNKIYSFTFVIHQSQPTNPTIVKSIFKYVVSLDLLNLKRYT